LKPATLEKKRASGVSLYSVEEYLVKVRLKNCNKLEFGVLESLLFYSPRVLLKIALLAVSLDGRLH